MDINDNYKPQEGEEEEDLLDNDDDDGALFIAVEVDDEEPEINGNCGEADLSSNAEENKAKAIETGEDEKAEVIVEKIDNTPKHEEDSVPEGSTAVDDIPTKTEKKPAPASKFAEKTEEGSAAVTDILNESKEKSAPITKVTNETEEQSLAVNEITDDLLVQEDDSQDSNATEEYYVDGTAAEVIQMPELIPIENMVALSNVSEMPVLTPAPITSFTASDHNLVPEISDESPVSPEELKFMEEDIDKLLEPLEQSEPNEAKDEVDDDLLMEVLSPKAPSVNESMGSSSGCSSAKKTSIVDSLLDKMRRKNSDSSGSEISKFQQTLSSSEDDLLVEIDVPVRYNKPSNPNQMATPIVRNQRLTSVFVNNEEEYQRMVAKHKFRKQIVEDRSKMNAKSEPPRMKAPEMPANIQRPRTLADKRILVNSSNTKFLMVEQESKIFRQVQRHEQKQEINYNHLDMMLMQEIPINHGPWKVLTWLRTREERYIQQYVNINGAKYKLNGSRGNHSHKILPEQSSDPLPRNQTTLLRSTRCCAAGRIGKRILSNLMNSANIRKFVLEESNDLYKRLETKRLDNQLGSIGPRPLAKKIEFINRSRMANNINDDDGAFLGDYAKFEMPNIQLEVEVKAKVSLNPTVKKYLKEILPHRDLNENWCEFALSALAVKGEEDVPLKKSFDFNIPYHENKQNILVREIIRTKEDHEALRIPPYEDTEDDSDDPMEWTFAKDVDKSDPVECEVADVIKDLTNSVFINLNDDLFTQEDAFDRSTPSVISPMKTKEAIGELSTLVKPDNSKKVLIELKRLNANIFKSQSECVDDVSYAMFMIYSCY
jgi:hypothetical protein